MYTFNSRVRYSELNHQRGTLSVSSIINYFQDCSTFQSEDLNVGLAYLMDNHRLWLLNGWQLELMRPIPLGEQIIIGTWPYDFKGFYGYRNFIMKNTRDEVLAVANSVWVHLDSETLTPVKFPPDSTDYVLEPSYPMEYLPRKVTAPKILAPRPPFPVVQAHIDSYNHVNNGQYVKMAEEFLPLDFNPVRMRIEYRSQARLGEIIHPKTAREGKDYYIVLADTQDMPYAIIQFTK